MGVIIGKKEYFKNLLEVKYEGQESDNPLAYRYYDKDRMVLGKTMREHFKFAIAYWHSFVNSGNDPFGPGTKIYPWATSSDVYERAYNKMDAAFEFISKLGLEYFCFPLPQFCQILLHQLFENNLHQICLNQTLLYL